MRRAPCVALRGRPGAVVGWRARRHRPGGAGRPRRGAGCHVSLRSRRAAPRRPGSAAGQRLGSAAGGGLAAAVRRSGPAVAEKSVGMLERRRTVPRISC